ncbi:MAG TPA: ABC-type transport auxiliary lipoprotein family protein [Casimicrobiaceae bacterium]|nr:ABC-type transport auxiliary lipoprotein family protein [Casimicrobiaceae bacterium]
MMSRTNPVATTIVALASLALAGGCSLTRPAPVKASYLLDPSWPAPVARTQPSSVRVGAITVAAPFRGRSFVVRDTDLRYDSDFYHEFFVPPAVIIGDATAQALVRGRVFADVTRPGVVVDSNWVLDGFVGALYGDARDMARPAAVLEITYFLSRDDAGSSTPVWTRAYQRRVAFTAGETSAYVAALNAALSEILAELAKDLAAAQLPAR